MTLPWLFGGTLAALAIGTVAGQILRLTARSEQVRATVANMNVGIAAWWVLCGAMGLALALGEGAVIALFALFSMLALREYVAVATPNAKLVPLVIFTLLQYGRHGGIPGEDASGCRQLRRHRPGPCQQDRAGAPRQRLGRIA